MIFPDVVVRYIADKINDSISGVIFVNEHDGKELINFFRCYGNIKDFYFDLPVKDYIYKQVELLNRQKSLKFFIESVINNNTSDEYNNCPLRLQPNEYKDLARQIDIYLRNFGYQIVYDVVYNYGHPYKFYEIKKIGTEHFVSTDALINSISCDNLNTQIDKAKYRINNTDYDGAITIARSLVEEILIYILKENGKKNLKHGDLMKLYKEVKAILQINPENFICIPPLIEILSGLNSIINGISNIRNKMSDSHSKEYKPSKHHAKLAVNSAFTLCEFLIESLIYQKTLSKKEMLKKIK